MKTAFPQYKGTTEIRLYSNIPFDNTYTNHSLISRKFKYNNTDVFTGSATLDACEMFINRKNPAITGSPYYYPRYDLTGEFNFDYANGLITAVVLELTPEQTNANYMRVKSHNNEGSEYYYYFITGITQINVDTYRLSLELDVLMTYQDEFLEGMKNVPVLTARKHSCRYNDDGYPNCTDFKNNEIAYAGVRPSITKSKYDLEFKGGMSKLSGTSWLYFAYEPISDASWKSPYNFNFCSHPVCMIAQPYNCIFSVHEVGSSTEHYFNRNINKLIGDGKVHGAKILPFPPFFDEDATVTTDTGGLYGQTRYHLESPHLQYVVWSEQTLEGTYWKYTFNSGRTDIRMAEHGTGHVPSGSDEIDQECWVIKSVESGKYKYKDVVMTEFSSQTPSPLSPRLTDPRLLFEPFSKYVLASPYSNDYEFFPELIYGEGYYSGNNFSFVSSVTAYIGDNNIITYLDNANYYKYYKELNIGMSANLNYTIPCGTNALDVFNSTQANSYYQSKIATGITSGLTIAGGVGSVALGVAGFVGGAFTGGASAVMGAGLIAGGVGGIASGTASAVNNAKSVNAKIEDLKNTPDSFNVQGSNYTSDYARTETNMPYVIVYQCSAIVREDANDFFYNFGYAVSRECYFNIDLTNDAYYSAVVDINLFNRDIFNYIQLNEDIANKINADIPQLVKQKMSAIFNKGITIWSWFGIDELWKTGEPALNNDYWLDRWFLKCDLDNTECDIVLGA